MPGHRIVDQDEIVIFVFAQKLDRRLAADGGRHEMTDLFEFVCNDVADQRIVVDQQNFKMRHASPLRNTRTQARYRYPKTTCHANKSSRDN